MSNHNALELLRADHRAVLGMIGQYEQSRDPDEQRELCTRIVDALKIHTELEEQVFYPFLRDSTADFDLVARAELEHGSVDELMHKMETDGLDDVHMHAAIEVLGEFVKLHVQEEESEMFPLIERTHADLDALGLELAERKRQLETGKQGASSDDQELLRERQDG